MVDVTMHYAPHMEEFRLFHSRVSLGWWMVLCLSVSVVAPCIYIYIYMCIQHYCVCSGVRIAAYVIYKYTPRCGTSLCVSDWKCTGYVIVNWQKAGRKFHTHKIACNNIGHGHTAKMRARKCGSDNCVKFSL